MENTNKIPLIIDADPGIDDALALIILSKNLKNFDLKLLTSCSGNTSIENTTKNLQFFAENYFNGVKVAKGTDKHLSGVFARAEDVHGANGLGGYKIGEPTYPVEDNAVEAIYNLLKDEKEKVVVVTLGPITNYANLLLKHPDVKDKIEVIYAMIGSIEGTGNITPYAEFNAYVDPEALNIVANSGIKIIFNTIEMGNIAKIKQSVFAEKEVRNKTDEMIKVLCLSVVETLYPGYVQFYDPCSVMVLLHPELFDFVRCNAQITTSGEEIGKCVLTEDKNGTCYYQKIKDLDKLLSCIMEELYK